MRRLLPGLRLRALALRGAAPVLIADRAGARRCGSRCGAASGPLAQAIAELVLWLAALALATRRLERGLLGELWGYLRAEAPAGARP